jgi:hypothetical protein
VSPFSNHLITVAGHYALEEQPEEGLNFDSPAPPRALADTRHTPQVKCRFSWLRWRKLPH